MPDWPAHPPQFPYHKAISLCGSPASCVFDAWQVSGSNANAGGTWPSANRAIYQPFIVEKTMIVTHIGFEVVTQAGNYDVGIYDEQLTRLVSLGSTSVPAAGPAKANISDTTLTPGLYYAAMNCSSATASIVRASAITAIWLQVMGVRQQAVGAVTLPNPMVPANPASAYVPNMVLITGGTF